MYYTILSIKIGAHNVIMQQNIEQKLESALSPSHIQVINESSGHNVPEGSESHFKVILVTQAFEGLRQIQRQQKVYQLLADELAGSVHALTMQTLTPSEWQADASITPSPQCLGGGK